MRPSNEALSLITTCFGKKQSDLVENLRTVEDSTKTDDIFTIDRLYTVSNIVPATVNILAATNNPANSSSRVDDTTRINRINNPCNGWGSIDDFSGINRTNNPVTSNNSANSLVTIVDSTRISELNNPANSSATMDDLLKNSGLNELIPVDTLVVANNVITNETTKKPEPIYFHSFEENGIKTETSIIYGRVFSSLFEKLSESYECTICLNEILKDNPNEIFTVIVHNENKSAPHCFHFQCFIEYINQGKSDCPGCQSETGITGKDRVDILLKIVLVDILKPDLSEDEKKMVEFLVSKIYDGNLSEIAPFFLGEKFSVDILENIIFKNIPAEGNQDKHEDLKNTIRDIIRLKKHAIKAEFNEFKKSWNRLLKLSKNDPGTVDFLVNRIIDENVASKITSLDLSNIRITTDNLTSFQRLFDKLENLKELDVSDSQLDEESFKSITELLVKCKDLESLNISGNMIGSNKLKPLLVGLTKCKKLKSLNISWNNIGVEGVNTLFGTFAELTSLDISSNNIDSAGIVNLLDILRCNCKKLQKVDISYNEIDDVVLDAIDRLKGKIKNVDVVSEID